MWSHLAGHRELNSHLIWVGTSLTRLPVMSLRYFIDRIVMMRVEECLVSSANDIF